MSISFSGLASGLDTSSWVKSLTALKQAKVTVLQEEREEIVSTRDLLKNIKSFFSSFRSTIEKITDSRFNIAQMDLFAQNLANSTNLDKITATATHEAVEGKYEVKVDKLASNTKAQSSCKRNTTIVEQTVANEDTLLSTVGVNAGRIMVTNPTNGISSTIRITENDTIGTFIEKLEIVGGEGIDASISKNGVFTVNLGPSNIVDLEGTNIINALHLEGVNEGYTSNRLQVEHKETVWDPATTSTKLSDLGVSAGTIGITANDAAYNINITNASTIGSFLSDLQGKGIDATFKDGIFRIENAEITDEGTTNIKTAFNMTEEISGKSQISNDLTFETTVVTQTIASADTKLADLGHGLTVNNGDTVVVQDSNGNNHTITLNSNSSVGDLLEAMKTNGLNATIKSDGTVEITGGKILNTGSFDAISALGLNEEAYTAYVTGNALTETVTVPEIVTLATEFVDDLKVTEGLLQVTDAEGTTHYLEIYDGLSIGEFITDLGNLGILGELDETTGVLTITGGEFDSLTQSEINTLDTQGKLNGVSLRTATDLLDLLFPDMGAATDVVQTFAVSRPLSRSVTNTILAEADTTTLGSLGLTGDETAVFNVRGTNVNVNVNPDMTINEFITALDNAGISASFDEDTHKLTIQNATLTSTGELADILGLTPSTSGKYTASVATYADSTIKINATSATTFEQLGILDNQTIEFYDETGKIATYDATKDTTIGDIISAANTAGLTASIENGVIKIEGGYIKNTAIEEVLGLDMTSSGVSHLLGTQKTDTEIVNADFTTKLEQITGNSANVSLTIKNRDGETVTNQEFWGSYTLGDLADCLETFGITVALSNGVLSFSSASGNYITEECGLAQALGIGTATQDVVVSNIYNSSNLNANKTLTTSRETTLAELGITDYALTINETDGDTITTTFTSGTNVGTILDWCSNNGVSASLSDGVISLSSASGSYVTGTLATAFGITTKTMTETTTIGVQQSSNIKLFTSTKTLSADKTTALSSVISSYGTYSKSITIKDSGSVAIATISADSTETIGSLFEKLSAYGFDGSIDGGVISLTSTKGNSITGEIANALRISETTATITTNGALTVNANSDTLLKDILGDDWSCTIPNNIIAIYDSKNPSNPQIDSITIQEDMTVGDMLTALAAFGIQGKITDGVITLTHTGGNVYAADAYPDGNGIFARLGIQTSNTSVLVTETIGNVVAGEAQTYETTVVATSDALLVELGKTIAAGDTLEIYDRIDGAVGTFTVTNTSTIKDLQDVLAEKGIATTMKNGVLTFDNTNGYVDGTVADKLGIETTGQTITTTIGTNATQTQEITYSYYTVASEDTTFGDLGLIAEGATSTVTVNGVDGYNIGFIYKISTNISTTGLQSMKEVYGTTNNLGVQTIKITSTEDLNLLADYVKEGGITKNTTFIMANDIDFNEELFSDPIGTEDNPFMGYFEGNGYVIKNAFIYDSESDSGESIGLFGYVQDARISNLGMEGCIVDSQLALNTGMLIGHCVLTSAAMATTHASGTYNCYTSGQIISYGQYTGGVIGYIDAPDSAILSTKFPFIGLMSDTSINSADTSGLVGGIIGCAEGYVKADSLVSMNKVIDGGRSDQLNEGALIGYSNHRSCIQAYTRCMVLNNYDYIEDAAPYVFASAQTTSSYVGTISSITVDKTLIDNSVMAAPGKTNTGCNVLAYLATVPTGMYHRANMYYGDLNTVNLDLFKSGLAYLTFTSESTIGEFLDAINENGIIATLENGVININNAAADSANGVAVDNVYLEGDLITAMGMTSTDHAVEDFNEIITSTLAVTHTKTVTVGNTLTSTAVVTYTTQTESTGYYQVTSSEPVMYYRSTTTTVGRTITGSSITYTDWVDTTTTVTLNTTFASMGIDTTDDKVVVTEGLTLNKYGLLASVSTIYTSSTVVSLNDVSSTSTITAGTYTISTTSELQKLATMTNNGYIQGGSFYLMNDLDLSGIDWTPIGKHVAGTTQYQFHGKFYGQGHSISNMNVTGDYQYAGLFGMNRGTIQDVVMIDCTVNQSNTSTTDTLGGIICGNNMGSTTMDSTIGTIDNVAIVGGKVIGTQIGGVAGGNNGTLRNAWTTATVDVLTNNSWNTCGGLVSHTSNGAYFYNCYALNDSVDSSGSYSAGLIGYFGSSGGTITVSSCYVGDTGAKNVFAARNANYYTINCINLTYASTISSATLGSGITATSTVVRSATIIDGFTGSTTLKQFLDATGYAYSLNSGKLNMYSKSSTNVEKYETNYDFLMGSIVEQLKLKRVSWNSQEYYGYGNYTTTSNDSDRLYTKTTVLASFTNETTFADLGLGDGAITLRAIGTENNYVVQYKAEDSIYDFFNGYSVGSAKISTSGALSVTPKSGYYFYDFPSELKTALGMTSSYSYNTIISIRTDYISICSEATFYNFDLYDDIYIELENINTGETTTHMAYYTDSISDALLEAGCTPIFQDGKLTIRLPEGYKLKDIYDAYNESVLDDLKIDVDDQTYVSDYEITTIQSTAPVKYTTALTLDTELGDIWAGQGMFYVSSSTEIFPTFDMSTTETLDDLFSRIGAYCSTGEGYISGNTLVFDETGSAQLGTITITNSLGEVVAKSSGTMCKITIPTTQTNGTHYVEKTLQAADCFNYTFRDIGCTGPIYITLKNTTTGDTITATFTETQTISSLFQWCSTQGQDINIEDGMVTFSQRNETCPVITGISNNLVQAFNLDKKSMIKDYEVHTLNSETTFADLGISFVDENVEIILHDIINDTPDYYYFSPDSSIYDSLISIGCKVTITNGKFTIEAPEGYYLESIRGAMSVNTDVLPYLNISSSDIGTTTSNKTVTMTSATTFASLGVTTTQTISVKNTETGAITAHTIGSSTSIYDALNNIEGLTAMIDGGKMKIIMDDGYCVTGMSNDMVTKLKFLKDTANIDSNKLCGDVSGTGLKRSLCLDQLVSSGGSWTIWDAATDSSHTVIEYTTDMSVGDFLDALAQGGVYSYIEDGKVTFVQGENYIKNENDALWQKLFGSGANSNAFEEESELYDYENDPSDALMWTHTTTMDYDSTLAQLGVTSNGGINIHVKNEDGTTQTVTVSYTTDMTIGELLEELEAYGIYGKIENGVLSFIPVGENYIVDMSNNNSFESGLGINLTDATTTRSYYKWVMSPSDMLSANLSSSSTFVELGVAAGTEMIITVNSAGTDVLVTIKAENTLSDFMAGLAGAGISSEIKDGIFTIKGSQYAYIKDMNNTLAGALGLTTSDTAYYTTQGNGTIINTNSTAHKTYSKTLPITDDTLLTNIASITTSDTLVVTKPDGTTSTIAVGTGDTVSDFFTKLSQCGLTGSIDTDGKISIVGQGDTTISGGVATKLGLSLTTIKDTITTNTNSNLLTETKTVNMHDGTTLEELGIIDNGGKLKLFKDGVEHTITLIDGWTVANFRDKLAEFGITSEIVDGRLSLTTNGVARFEEVDSNAVAQLGLTNWSTVGSFSQESDQLSDISVLHPAATLQSRIEELTDADGDNLGITNGNIYVYQDGTRHTFAIDKSETLGTLASRLASYGITLSIDQDGVISFAGNGNSYMESIAGGSNIIDVLNIDSWTEVNDYTSKNLKYEEDDTATINGDTKMIDILGGSEAVTTGKYNVVANGVTTTEEITDDTTVNDFIATLSTYGMTASVNSNGQIAVGGQNNTYLMTSNYATGNSNVVQALFTEWEFVNVYESNNLEIPTPVIESITRDTKLSNINEGTYQEGLITVVKDGVQINVTLTADDTVGTFMDTLELHGFNCVLNDSGQLTIMSTGDSIIKNYNGTGASNALDLLGVESSDWVTTNMYSGEAIDVIEEATYNTAVARDTELSELGITTGEYYIYNNGVRYSALVSSDETVGSFLETLATFGIQGNLVSNGTYAVLELKGSGESYIEKSSSVNNASNIADILFPDASDTTYNYEASLKTDRIVTTYNDVTEDTLISNVYTTWTDNVNKAQGELSITIDGETLGLNIAPDETFGSLINRLNSMGLEATLMNGELMIQSGYAEFTINSTGTTSNIVNDLGLAYHDDLGGYMQSNDTVISTTTHDEIVDESVSQWANYDTKMSLLNISSGTLSIYKNGEKATIQVDENETFGQLQSRIASAHSGVDIKFEDGYLTFFSTAGDSVEVGATTDTSNIMAICGLSNDKSGTVKSGRELYRVNGSSKITDTGLFRRGNVTEGTFVIGNQTFEITENTTLNNLISQINASEDANATASWDSIAGKLVITSRSTGAALINIEAGTSNFTDIMGLTTTERNPDNSVITTKINVDSQEIGDNASFSINGTHYNSTSNTIGSDLTRITGLTINLKGVTEGSSVTLTVERDKETVANAVSDVVDAYNELIEKVDKEVARGGKLAKESTLKLIRNQIRTLMTSSIPGASIFKNLDQVGISSEAASANNINTDKVDVLYFDKAKFIEAFDADRDALKNLIVGTDSDLGIFSKIETVLESSLAGVYGYFDSATKSYDNQISRLDDKIEKATKAVERYKLRLEAKFSAMDRLIASIQNQYSNFLG